MQIPIHMYMVREGGERPPSTPQEFLVGELCDMKTSVVKQTFLVFAFSTAQLHIIAVVVKEEHCPRLLWCR